MELRQIWSILVRRWWLVLIPPLLVAAASLRSWRSLISPPVTYSAAVRFTVGQPPLDPATGYDPRYYSWLTSEYIATGLRDWIHGYPFAQAVSADVQRRHNLTVPPEAIVGAVTSDSAHSLLVLYVTAGTAEETAAIADSAAHVLSDPAQNSAAFPQFGHGGAVVTPQDSIAVGANAPALRDRLDLPLRVGLGLLGGLALAFLVDYLDPALHTRGQVEALGYEVLAGIPRKRRRLR